MGGRQCSLTLELMDKPGQLVAVSKIIADCGGNVTAVLHERTNTGTAINGCYLKLQIETRNFEHIAEIKTKLIANGFKVV
jgi:threonine dehydratase